MCLHPASGFFDDKFLKKGARRMVVIREELWRFYNQRACVENIIREG
jgi:hypothetical protein